jgi:CCR4-NOT transcription complex subunit 2
MPSQQQPNGTQGTMSSLLVQPSGLGGAPSVSSSNEVALDPNDFPALGSGPTNPNPSSTANGLNSGTTSYASQAGTGVLLTGSGGSGGNGTSSNLHQTRDFTPDDFPALGGGINAQQGQGAQQQSRDGSSATNGGTPDNSLSHPPGLNGFQTPEQQLRQNLLGPHTPGLHQNTPGLLNLGPTHRNVHPGFQGQSEAEKQQQRVSLHSYIRIVLCTIYPRLLIKFFCSPIFR